MIVLPVFPPRRAWLMSFWLLMSLAGGLALGVAFSVVKSSHWMALGVILGLILMMPGLFQPSIASFPYRAWNRLAHDFARCARLWLMVICFYVILIAAGRSGSSLRLTRPDGSSLWVPRAEPQASHHDRPGITTEDSFSKGWVSAYLSWVATSGNWWAYCLLPFLLLLALVETEQFESQPPADIYTLF